MQKQIDAKRIVLNGDKGNLGTIKKYKSFGFKVETSNII